MTRFSIFALLLLTGCAATTTPTVIAGTPVPNPPPIRQGVDDKKLDMIHSDIKGAQEQIQGVLDQHQAR